MTGERSEPGPDGTPLGPGTGTVTALTRACAHRPWLVVAITGVLLALSLASLSRLRVSASLEAMLGLNSPAAAALHHFTTHYQAADALLILVDMPPSSAAGPAGPAGLEDHAALTAFAGRLAGALLSDPSTRGRVAWAEFRRDAAYAAFAREVIFPNAPYYLGADAARELLDRLKPERLRAQLARNESLIAAPGPAGSALSAAVLRDPLRLIELVPRTPGAPTELPLDDSGAAPDAPPELSSDGRALLIRVGATAPIDQLDEAAALTDAVGRVIHDANPGPLRVSVGGPYAIAAASARTIRADAIVSTLLSVALLYGLFVVFFGRRWLVAVLIGLAAGAGMIAGFGVHALAAPTISPLAAGVAALLAGLGVDYGIHFVAHFHALRGRGVSPEDAAIHTARLMATPIITNCFTSIFGFISLWPSRVQMLSDFARMGTLGLIGCLVAAFTLLPALLVLAERRFSSASIPRPRFGVIADVAARRPRTWMISTLIVLAAAIIGAGFQGFVPRLEGDLRVLHPQPNSALSATDEVISRFAGQGEFIPVLVRAADPARLIGAAHAAAAALTAERPRRAGVAEVLGIHLLLPDPSTAPAVRDLLNRADPDAALADFDRALEDSPFDPAAYAGYRRFVGQLLAARDPPDVETLRRYPSIARRLFPVRGPAALGPPSETVLLVRLSTPLRDRERRGEVVRTLNDALRGAPGASLAGLAAVSEDLEDATRRGLVQSVLISLVLVLAWLLIVFRRVRDVLLAITPLAFAGTLTVAFLVAVGGRLNPINSIAIPLLDGIAVDAGVFLVSAARRARRGRAELLRELRPTVHAVLLATTTTITGFASLWAMHTPALQSLGLVGAFGIAASVLGALGLLVPILVIAAMRRRDD